MDTIVLYKILYTRAHVNVKVQFSKFKLTISSLRISISDMETQPEPLISPSTETMIRRLITAGYYLCALPFKVNSVGQVEMAGSLHLKSSLLTMLSVTGYSSLLTVRLMFKFSITEVKYLWYLLLQLFSAMAAGIYINTYTHRHEVVELLNTSNLFYQDFKSKCNQY